MSDVSENTSPQIKSRSIGRTGLAVTEVGFGAGSLGNLYRAVGRDASDEVLNAAWNGGVRYFDTAPFYGFGLSERRLGDFLQGKARDSFVISTKVGRLLRPVTDGRIPDHNFVQPLSFAPEYDYGYDGVMRSVEDSLARLGLPSVDIVYVHDIGTYWHGESNEAQLKRLMDGGILALEKLRSSGAIRAFGLGVNEVDVCLRVMKGADLDCILLANRYTLLDRSAELELLPECERRGVSLVIGGVFNSGILATGLVAGAHYEYGNVPVEVRKRVEEMGVTAHRNQVPLAAAALQFPLRNSNVASVLIGTGSASNLKNNLELLRASVPCSAWAELDIA